MSRVAVIERVSEAAHQLPFGSKSGLVVVGMALVLIGVVVDGVLPGRRSGASTPKGR